MHDDGVEPGAGAVPPGFAERLLEVIDAGRRTAGAVSLHLARQRLAGQYEVMLDQVEATVAAQPLPRLQRVGGAEAEFPFIYDLGWKPREHFSVTRLRAAGPRGLPVRLRPGAGDELVRLGRRPAGIHAVARSIYRHLPPGVTPVWLGRGQVTGGDPAAALAALTAAAR